MYTTPAINRLMTIDATSGERRAASILVLKLGIQPLFGEGAHEGSLPMKTKPSIATNVSVPE